MQWLCHNHVSGSRDIPIIMDMSVDVFCIIGPVAGFLALQFGFRCTSLLGALLATSGLIISAFAQNMVVIFISMGLMTGEYWVG